MICCPTPCATRARSTPAVDARWRLIFCLRLAVLLHRSRDDEPLPRVLVKPTSGGFAIELPADWLLANPLSAATLAAEAQLWQRVGAILRVKRRAATAG